MKTLQKYLIYAVAAIVATVCIVFAGALIWINTNHALSLIQTRINAIIPGEIIVERHELSLLTPGIELHGVSILDPRGIVLAGAEQLSVELSWRPIFQKEIRITSILLSQPWADLAIQESEGLNLIRVFVPESGRKENDVPKSGGGGFPFNIVCKNARIINGRLSFVMSDKGLRLHASGISASAEGDLTRQHATLDLQASDLRFSGAGIQLEPAHIDLKSRLDGDQLAVSGLVIETGQTKVNLAGAAEDLFSAPTADIVLAINGQLEDLKKIFGLSGEYAGPLAAKLTVAGVMANPDARLNLSLRRSRLAGQPLDSGELRIDLHDRQAVIEPLVLRLAEGSTVLKGTVDLQHAFSKGFFNGPSDVDHIAYDLQLEPDIPNLNPWLNRFVDLSGGLTGRLSLSGNGVTPKGICADLSLRASGKNLLAAGMDRPLNADMTVAARMEKRNLTVSQIKGVADGVDISGDGHYQMDAGAFAGNLKLSAQNLARALAVAGVSGVDGNFTAKISANGDLAQPQFQLDVVADDLSVDAYRFGNVALKADLDPDGNLTLENLTLKNQGSHIHGNGHIRLKTGGGIDPNFDNTVTLLLETASVSDFMQPAPLEGVFDGQFALNGPLTSLSGGLSLKGRSLKADAFTIGDADTHLRLKDGMVEMTRLEIRNQSSAIDATGNVQLFSKGSLRLLDNPAFHLLSSSDHVDPGHFIEFASGDFRFSSELAGRIENPDGNIELSGRRLNVAGQFVETLALDGRFQDRRFWIDRLSAQFAPGEVIGASGWLGLDKAVDLHLNSAGVAVSRIQYLKDYFPGEGNLHVDIAAKGVIDNPDIDGRVIVTDIRVNDEVLDDVDLNFSLRDMQAKVHGYLNFQMDVDCDLRHGDFDARMTFDRTETAAYFKAAGKPQFHGTLTGDVQANGNIRDVANAAAQVELSAVNLLFEDIPLIQSDRIALQLSEKKLSINAFDMSILTEGHLRMQGDAMIRGDINVAVDSRIPLAVAKKFSDAFGDATGMVMLDGKISGETNLPQFDARIDLEDIGMTVPGLAQRLRRLNGSILVTPRSISTDNLKGYLDTGAFSLSGRVDHQNFVPVGVDLDIAARSMPLEVIDTLSVVVNGDIQITGQDRSATARGEIILLEGIYFKDVNTSLLQVASTATERRRSVAPNTEPMAIPYFDTVNLNIAIGHRQPFAVENNVAQMDISPDLKIGGTLANPIISGRAQVRDGIITFQKRDFDITKGVVDFINPYRTEAEIDIESEAEIRTWEITLALKGKLDNLDVTLTSVPSETEADILSLILLGRTTQELSSGQGGIQRTTSQIMAGMIADTFGDEIKRNTGVDILQVENTDSDNGEDASGVKVTVGKHLSNRMTVKYAIETINGETKQWAIMEYKLLERILVNGSQSTTGLFGAELIYRIEFR